MVIFRLSSFDFYFNASLPRLRIKQVLEKEGAMFVLGLSITPGTRQLEKRGPQRLFRAATSSLLGDGAKSTVTAQSRKEERKQLSV